MLKVFYFPVKPPLKVNILAAGEHHTKLLEDEAELMTFTEPVIPVADKSRLVENVRRGGLIYDALVFTEMTYLTGYGFIHEDVLPEEAVQAIDNDEVQFEELTEPPEKPAVRILFFEEKLAGI